MSPHKIYNSTMMAGYQLVCPHCSVAGKMAFLPNLVNLQRVVCKSCAKSLNVHQGVPDFATHLHFKKSGSSPAQWVMNSRIFAAIYESPAWRPLHTYIGSGMTMTKEIEEVFLLSGVSNATSVADIACGTGHYARAMAMVLPKTMVYAVDVSPSMLTKGRLLAIRKRIFHILFLRGDIYRLPFADDSIDWIHCGGALHLFSNLSLIWQEINRVLIPSGHFSAMTIPLAKHGIRRIQRHMMAHGKATFFNPDELEKDLYNVGFEGFRFKIKRSTLLFSVKKNRDRGRLCSLRPPTPPCVRIRTRRFT